MQRVELYFGRGRRSCSPVTSVLVRDLPSRVAVQPLTRAERLDRSAGEVRVAADEGGGGGADTRAGGEEGGLLDHPDLHRARAGRREGAL